jgi:hypothetical protein
MCACTVPDLPVADQKNAFELWHSFYQVFEVVYVQKTARPIFMQLVAFYHAKKQHFKKKHV